MQFDCIHIADWLSPNKIKRILVMKIYDFLFAGSLNILGNENKYFVNS